MKGSLCGDREELIRSGFIGVGMGVGGWGF